MEATFFLPLKKFPYFERLALVNFLKVTIKGDKLRENPLFGTPVIVIEVSEITNLVSILQSFTFFVTFH